jgi:hypothetical protein
LFRPRFRATVAAMRAAPVLILAPVLASALAGAAHAQAPQGLPPHEVSPVTVLPTTDPPKIVKSYPAAGQAVAAGVLVMSVTFNQPMEKRGFDVEAAAGGLAPKCLKTPRLLDDNKTFVLLCTIAPRASYSVAFNAAPQGGFRNVGDVRATPATLAFTTTPDVGPRDVADAVKAAGLRPIDGPIEEPPEEKPEP